MCYLTSYFPSSTPTLRPVKFPFLNRHTATSEVHTGVAECHTLINHIVTIGLLNVVTLVTLFFNWLQYRWLVNVPTVHFCLVQMDNCFLFWITNSWCLTATLLPFCHLWLINITAVHYMPGLSKLLLCRPTGNAINTLFIALILIHVWPPRCASDQLTDAFTTVPLMASILPAQ